MPDESEVIDNTEPRKARKATIVRTEWYRRPIFLAPLGILLGLILIYFLFDSVLMPWYVKSGKESVVPQVVGKRQSVAIKQLKDAGYEPVQYEVRFDDQVSEGTIIRQTPEGGQETKPGRKVYLIISGGKEMAVVPDLRGKSLRDAKMLLLKANLSVGNTGYEYTDSAVNGTVFKQIPSPGQKISSSTKVHLTISEGPLMGRVPAPALAKLTLSEAIAKLNAAKLTLGNVTFQMKADQPANTVIDQYPQPGELLVEGSSVDVFVVRETGESANPENQR